MNGNLREKFLNWFTIALVVIVVVGGAAIALPSWNRSRDLRNREAELRSVIEQKNAEIARLTENQRRFRTDSDFVEKIARQNRRVFPGELVFIFED